MRPVRALALYIVVVFIGGALLAPWLYLLAQACAHTLPYVFSGLFQKIAGEPFHRYVNRSLLGLALIGLWPLLRNLGLGSPRDVGLVRPGGQWSKLGGGFLLGLLSLAIVAGLALAAQARQINDSLTLTLLGERLVGITLTAFVVAVLEEILFRGALFGSLRRVFHWVFALVLSSMIYAIVHFLRRVEYPDVVTWSSGLIVLLRMLGGFADFHALVPGFLNLTLAGTLLGLAYQRTGNLYFSIGLHAGWIFWLKAYGVLTRTLPGAQTWFWGTGKLIDGWLALPILTVALFFFIQLRVGKAKGYSA